MRSHSTRCAAAHRRQPARHAAERRSAPPRARACASGGGARPSHMPRFSCAPAERCFRREQQAALQRWDAFATGLGASMLVVMVCAQLARVAPAAVAALWLASTLVLRGAATRLPPWRYRRWRLALMGGYRSVALLTGLPLLERNDQGIHSPVVVLVSLAYQCWAFMLTTGLWLPIAPPAHAGECPCHEARPRGAWHTPLSSPLPTPPTLLAPNLACTVSTALLLWRGISTNPQTCTAFAAEPAAAQAMLDASRVLGQLATLLPVPLDVSPPADAYTACLALSLFMQVSARDGWASRRAPPSESNTTLAPAPARFLSRSLASLPTTAAGRWRRPGHHGAVVAGSQRPSRVCAPSCPADVAC